MNGSKLRLLATLALLLIGLIWSPVYQPVCPDYSGCPPIYPTM
jgi:hypothetical protein